MLPSRKAVYRQLAALSCLFLVLMAALTVFHSHLLDRVFREITRNSLKTAAALIAVRIADGTGISGAQLEKEIAPFAGAADARVTIVTLGGTVLFDSEKRPADMENHLGRPEIAMAIKEGDGFSERYSNTLGANLLYYARRIDLQGRPGVVIRVSRPSFIVHHLFDPYKYEILAGIFLSLVGVALLFLFFMHRLGRKAAAVADAANEMARGDYSPQLPATRDDLFYPAFSSLAKLGRTIQQLMDEVNDRNRMLTRIMWEIPVPIVIFSAGRVIQFKTRAFEEMIPGIETIDQMLNTMRLGDLSLNAAALKDVGARFAMEAELNRRYYQVHGLRVAEQPEPLAMIVFFDVTEIRAVQKMKMDFTANVSHELKTPLTVIKGFVETLEDELPEEKKFMLDAISKHITRFEALIADVLLLSRSEARETCSSDPVCLNDILLSALKLWDIQIRKRNITVSVDAQEAVWVMGDEPLLAQLVDNLLSNAIKFNKEDGRIDVILFSKSGKAVLAVRDTGIGIPPEHQPNIFQRFYVVDKSRSRELGGTGLGLAIVKHITELHGGSVELSSVYGQGTEVAITLPAASEKGVSDRNGRQSHD